MSLSGAQKMRLGTFLVAGLVVVVGSLLLLAGLKAWEPRTLYRCRFTESVSGLERSAPVRYQGLRVGRVESMAVAADDPRAIEVVLALEPHVPLYEGTLAVLDVSGLTGLKNVNLTAGDPRRSKLPAGAMLPTGPSLFDRLTDNAASIVGDVKHVTDQLSKMMTADNRLRLESLLGNLDRFVGNLDEVLTRSHTPIRELIGQVSRTTVAIGDTAGEAGRTLRAVRGAVERTEATVDATLGAVRQPLSGLAPGEVRLALGAVRGAAQAMQARLSAAESGRAIAAFGATVERSSRLVEDLDLAVRSGREDFTASLSSLRQAAEDLREFSRMLAQNPSVLVRGREERE